MEIIELILKSDQFSAINAVDNVSQYRVAATVLYVFDKDFLYSRKDSVHYIVLLTVVILTSCKCF